MIISLSCLKPFNVFPLPFGRVQIPSQALKDCLPSICCICHTEFLSVPNAPRAFLLRIFVLLPMPEKPFPLDVTWLICMHCLDFNFYVIHSTKMTPPHQHVKTPLMFFHCNICFLIVFMIRAKSLILKLFMYCWSVGFFKTCLVGLWVLSTKVVLSTLKYMNNRLGGKESR